MRRIFSLVILLLFPSMAAANCVSYNFEPDPGSGFAGFGRFENSCSYQVVIRFRYSDGQTGLAGPLKPGQTERGYHGEAREIEYTWCDFGASACSPPEIGVSMASPSVPNQRSFDDVLDALEVAEKEFFSIVETWNSLCNPIVGGNGSTSQCAQLSAQMDAKSLPIDELNAELGRALTTSSTNEVTAGPQQGSSSIGDPNNNETASTNADDIVPACTDITVSSPNLTHYSFKGGCGRDINCEVYTRSTGESSGISPFNNANIYHDKYRLVCRE